MNTSTTLDTPRVDIAKNTRMMRIWAGLLLGISAGLIVTGLYKKFNLSLPILGMVIVFSLGNLALSQYIKQRYTKAGRK